MRVWLMCIGLIAVCSGHVRPAQLRPQHRLARHRAVHACADDEVARARRRRDEDSRKKEMDGAGSELVDADMELLRDYIGIVKEKETNLVEIKGMLRTMQQTVGVQFVSDEDEIQPAAWVFVALNVAVAAYLANGLLVQPVQRSVEALT